MICNVTAPVEHFAPREQWWFLVSVQPDYCVVPSAARLLVWNQLSVCQRCKFRFLVLSEQYEVVHTQKLLINIL